MLLAIAIAELRDVGCFTGQAQNGLAELQVAESRLSHLVGLLGSGLETNPSVKRVGLFPRFRVSFIFFKTLYSALNAHQGWPLSAIQSLFHL